MKVTLSAESKAAISLSKLAAAKHVIAMCKEDESSAADYALIAARSLNSVYLDGYDVRVFDVKANVMPHSGVWGWWGDDSEDLDVWIEATADCSVGFIKFGAYMSDICGISYDTRNDFAAKAYKRVFSEDKI